MRILFGVLLICAGIAVLLAGRVPLGHLPGDIAFRRRNFSFYFPVTSSIVVSVLLSLLFYLLARFRR